MSKLICPAFDESCPYCKRGFCFMKDMTGDNPHDECDEWYGVEEDEDDE